MIWFRGKKWKDTLTSSIIIQARKLFFEGDKEMRKAKFAGLVFIFIITGCAFVFTSNQVVSETNDSKRQMTSERRSSDSNQEIFTNLCFFNERL